jgi:hypothetical protein
VNPGFSQYIYASTTKIIGVFCYFYVYPYGAGTVGPDIISHRCSVEVDVLPRFCGVFCYYLHDVHPVVYYNM